MAFDDIKVYLSPLDVMPEHHAERARQELVDMFEDLCDRILKEPQQPPRYIYAPALAHRTLTVGFYYGD